MIPIQSSKYSILSNLPLLSVGILFVLCVASPRKISLRANCFVAVALFMLYLGQNHAWRARKIANRLLESTNYTHENIGDGHNSGRTNEKCESIPKPPYLSWIVTYEDDQAAIFHSGLRWSIFRPQKHFCSRLHLQLLWWRHYIATSTSFKLKLKLDLKYFWDR